MTLRALGEVLDEVKRPEVVQDDEGYRILGVRWYAEGAWVKSESAGSEIKAPKVFRLEAGDLIYNRLFAWKGSFAVIPDELDGCFVSNEFPAFRVRTDSADVDYIMMLLSQPALWEQIERESTGVASISRKRLKVQGFLKIELPLPDLSQQRAIHARYSQSRSSVSAVWQRVTEALQDVADLRQTILQLAVMGCLVPQDPNDEPASELLKKIQTEKQRLIAEGTIRKTKPLPPIDAEELPFELPEGWACERLGALTWIRGGVTKGRKLAGRTTAEYPYLRVANVQRGFLDLSEIKIIAVPVEELEKYALEKGDLLVVEGGDWDKVGRSAIWTGAVDPCLHQNHVFRVRSLVSGLDPHWLMSFTNSAVGREHFERASKQTTNLASINMTQLKTCVVPIPPDGEQQRIIAKVDQLMTLCDDLEAKLQQSQTDADNLLAAIVHELTQTGVNSQEGRPHGK